MVNKPLPNSGLENKDMAGQHSEHRCAVFVSFWAPSVEFPGQANSLSVSGTRAKKGLPSSGFHWKQTDKTSGEAKLLFLLQRFWASLWLFGESGISGLTPHPPSSSLKLTHSIVWAFAYDFPLWEEILLMLQNSQEWKLCVLKFSC